MTVTIKSLLLLAAMLFACAPAQASGARLIKQYSASWGGYSATYDPKTGYASSSSGSSSSTHKGGYKSSGAWYYHGGKCTEAKKGSVTTCTCTWSYYKYSWKSACKKYATWY